MLVEQSVIEDNILLIRLSGRFDHTSFTDITPSVTEHLGNGYRHFIFNCKDVEYMTSAGLRYLLATHNLVIEKEGDILLCALNEPVKNVLYLTGCDNFITILDDEASAIEMAKAS